MLAHPRRGGPDGFQILPGGRRRRRNGRQEVPLVTVPQFQFRLSRFLFEGLVLSLRLSVSLLDCLELLLKVLRLANHVSVRRLDVGGHLTCIVIDKQALDRLEAHLGRVRVQRALQHRLLRESLLKCLTHYSLALFSIFKTILIYIIKIDG